jgi:hypothetical protein
MMFLYNKEEFFVKIPKLYFPAKMGTMNVSVPNPDVPNSNMLNVIVPISIMPNAYMQNCQGIDLTKCPTLSNVPNRKWTKLTNCLTYPTLLNDPTQLGRSF